MKKPFVAARLVPQRYMLWQVLCHDFAVSPKITLRATFKTFCTLFATERFEPKK